MIDTYQRSYFTFGSDHTLPDGTTGLQALHSFVIVVGPKWVDRRDLFMCWLGSNHFAFEYNEEEWEERGRKYYKDAEPHTVLRVDELTT